MLHLPTGATLNSSQVYRSLSKRIPRQTLHNRKKKKLCDTPEAPVDISDGMCSPDVIFDISSDDTTVSLDDMTPPAVTTPDVPSDDSNTPTRRHNLFAGSSLDVATSYMLISTFMCRHHLTHQAKSDLLQLLHIHLPDENSLPSSVYTFQKMNSNMSVSCDPAVTEHRYCSHCYMVLPDPASTACSNECSRDQPLPLNSTPHFFTISIADQLKVLFKRQLK